MSGDIPILPSCLQRCRRGDSGISEAAALKLRHVSLIFCEGCALRPQWGGTVSWFTGVHHSQETPPSEVATVGLCLGPCGGPRGGGLFLMSEVPL